MGMELDREVLISKAERSASFEELAEKIGWGRSVESFVEEVSGVCPGIELLLERTECLRELEQCRRMKDEHGRRDVADRLQDLTIELIDAGLGSPMILSVPLTERVPTAAMVRGVRGKQEEFMTKNTKIAKPAKAVKPLSKIVKSKADVPASKKKAPTESPSLIGKKRPACTDEQVTELRKTLKSYTESIGCDPLKGDVLGLSPEGAYQGRTRVVLHLRAAVFGVDVVGTASIRQVTVHNGILNHCNLEETPSPYWAVLDAMSDLGIFKKEDVLARAVKLHGKNREVGRTVEQWMKALSIAYDVLKTHHVHPRKCFAGMSHMVTNCGSANPVDNGKAEIRGRKGHETYEYFVEKKKKLEGARNGGAPMASLER